MRYRARCDLALDGLAAAAGLRMAKPEGVFYLMAEYAPSFRLSIARSQPTLARGVKLIAGTFTALIEKEGRPWQPPLRISSVA
jgi:aspartate/methionine/tyrosine aminotransferase